MFIHFRLDLTDHHLKLTTTFTDSDYITDMINSMLRSEKKDAFIFERSIFIQEKSVTMRWL